MKHIDHISQLIEQNTLNYYNSTLSNVIVSLFYIFILFCVIMYVIIMVFVIITAELTAKLKLNVQLGMYPESR